MSETMTADDPSTRAPEMSGPSGSRPTPEVLAAIVQCENDRKDRDLIRRKRALLDRAEGIAVQLAKMSEAELARRLGKGGTAELGGKRYRGVWIADMRMVEWTVIGREPERIDGAHAVTDAGDDGEGDRS